VRRDALFNREKILTGYIDYPTLERMPT